MNIPSLYKPQPGSIPAQSLVTLAGTANGRLASAALLEAIGQPHNYAGLGNCLALCVDNGLLLKERDGNLTFWSITATGLRVARDLSASDDQQVDTSAEARAPRQPAQEPKPDDTGADFALTANGRLLIEANGRQVMLDQAQTDKLIEYIDAQRGVEWEAA